MRKISGKPAIILLSGGLDSATALYLAKKRGYKLSALIFDYRQRHRKEIRFAVKLSQLTGINYYIVKVSLFWAQSALTKKNIKVSSRRNLNARDIPSTYVSGRNIIFLSYAASFAESIGAKKIFFGAHIQDYSGYPDCRPEFIASMEKSLNLGLSHRGIQIIAPLLGKNKKDIIILGNKLSVPFEYTWSCYNGGRYPCGKCDSCRFRIKAFQDLGLQDPLVGSRNIHPRGGH